MKYLLSILFIVLFFSCKINNKTHPLELESIKKNKSGYNLIVSTQIDLNEIKLNHNFSDQRFIGHLKNKEINDYSIIIAGNFDTALQLKKGNKYYYTINVTIEEKERKLAYNDTIIAYLQLSYKEGRTYPTKSIEIPANSFISLK